MHHPHWNGRIIGLWGAAKVGKDTIQRHLGWPRAAFADRLKLDLAPIFSRLGLDLENPNDKSIARSLMVEYGRLGRIIDPDIWIRRLELPEDEDHVECLDGCVDRPPEPPVFQLNAPLPVQAPPPESGAARLVWQNVAGLIEAHNRLTVQHGAGYMAPATGRTTGMRVKFL